MGICAACNVLTCFIGAFLLKRQISKPDPVPVFSGLPDFLRGRKEVSSAQPREPSEHHLRQVGADCRGSAGPTPSALRRAGALLERSGAEWSRALLDCRSHPCQRYAETWLRLEFSSRGVRAAPSPSRVSCLGLVCVRWALRPSSAACVLLAPRHRRRPSHAARSGVLPYRGFCCPSPGCAGLFSPPIL